MFWNEHLYDDVVKYASRLQGVIFGMLFIDIVMVTIDIAVTIYTGSSALFFVPLAFGLSLFLPLLGIIGAIRRSRTLLVVYGILSIIALAFNITSTVFQTLQLGALVHYARRLCLASFPISAHLQQRPCPYDGHPETSIPLVSVTLALSVVFVTLQLMSVVYSFALFKLLEAERVTYIYSPAPVPGYQGYQASPVQPGGAPAV